MPICRIACMCLALVVASLPLQGMPTDIRVACNKDVSRGAGPPGSGALHLCNKDVSRHAKRKATGRHEPGQNRKPGGGFHGTSRGFPDPFTVLRCLQFAQ
eukprot:3486306-Alexandrium_andersonii.AAC.1